MTKLEIAQVVAAVHNRLMQATVRGDEAIMIGESLKELRVLSAMLNEDIKAEKATESAEE